MSDERITDTVAQTTLLTVGLTSATATANMTTAASQALSLAMLNAVANQQQGNTGRMVLGAQAASGAQATGNAVNGRIVSGLTEA